MATITPRCSLSLLVLAVTAAHAVTAHAATQLQLSPQNTEYRSHCEGDTADPKWPCFTFWKGDLRDSWAVLDHSPDSPNDFFPAKDGALTDFTTRSPAQPFTLLFADNDLAMQYANFRDGCFDIKLFHFTLSGRRIWVSDDDGKGRDVDTLHHDVTGKRLCSKWVHIYVKSSRS